MVAAVHHRFSLDPIAVRSVPVIQEADDGFRVEGLAFVQARPRGREWRRSRRQAREIAKRIARDPVSYLAVCAELHVPGVADLRGLVANAGGRISEFAR